MRRPKVAAQSSVRASKAPSESTSNADLPTSEASAPGRSTSRVRLSEASGSQVQRIEDVGAHNPSTSEHGNRRATPNTTFQPPIRAVGLPGPRGLAARSSGDAGRSPQAMGIGWIGELRARANTVRRWTPEK